MTSPARKLLYWLARKIEIERLSYLNRQLENPAKIASSKQHRAEMRHLAQITDPAIALDAYIILARHSQPIDEKVDAYRGVISLVPKLFGLDENMMPVRGAEIASREVRRKVRASLVVGLYFCQEAIQLRQPGVDRSRLWFLKQATLNALLVADISERKGILQMNLPARKQAHLLKMSGW